MGDDTRYLFKSLSIPITMTGAAAGRLLEALEKARTLMLRESEHDMQYSSFTKDHGPCEICERRERERLARLEDCAECNCRCHDDE